jgi:aspartate/methionine/tyrosine aminotransferase
LPVYKEGVGLFVWAKLPSGIASAEAFINDILYQNIYLSPRNNFGSNGEGYIRFALCKRKKIQEAIDRFCLSLSE